MLSSLTNTYTYKESVNATYSSRQITLHFKLITKKLISLKIRFLRYILLFLHYRLLYTVFKLLICLFSELVFNVVVVDCKFFQMEKSIFAYTIRE